MRIIHAKRDPRMYSDKGYWFKSKHGMGPGTIPNDCKVLDWCEPNYYTTYMKLDRFLTTSELNEYELKEMCPPKGSVTHNGDIIEGCTAVKRTIKKTNSSTVRKVSEDARTISYNIESDDRDEYIGGATEADDAESIAEEEEDFLDQPAQEYSSAQTAINGKHGKLPAVFKKASIPNGSLVLDYGGGTAESEAVAQNYLDQFDAKEMLYDPFNQTADHNREVVSILRKNGGADVAICSNVLNVVKEQEVRLDILKKIRKLLKSGATAYISVYEGPDAGSGKGKVTQNGASYQNNKKLANYLEEVQAVFPDAKKKGNVIVAPNSGKITASVDLNSLDTIALEDEIKNAIRNYMMSPYGGWPKDEVDEAVADYTDVDLHDELDHLVVEVRCELSYEGLERLASRLDKIIEKYDPDSYFEPVTSGILEAYIWGKDAIEGTTNILSSGWDDEAALAQHESLQLDPEWDNVSGYVFKNADPEDIDDVEVEFPFEFDIESDEDAEYIDLIDPSEFFDRGDSYEDQYIADDILYQDVVDTLARYLPETVGKFHVSGTAFITYSYSDEFYVKDSHIDNFECSPIEDAIEGTTNIRRATLTEDELNSAILEGRPFDIASFKETMDKADPQVIRADQVEVGDTIDVECDASEVNLGTVVKVVAINDPEEDWIDFTFHCRVVENPGGQSIKVGDIIDLHFDADEKIGYIVPV